MQERAQRIGATVQVESAPGAGCSIVLELPRAAHEEAATASLAGAHA
jgi:nitrate/nitrite-specific signal transduction histidine kinase